MHPLATKPLLRVLLVSRRARVVRLSSKYYLVLGSAREDWLCETPRLHPHPKLSTSRRWFGVGSEPLNRDDKRRSVSRRVGGTLHCAPSLMPLRGRSMRAS
jgi:hypothetical protein